MSKDTLLKFMKEITYDKEAKALNIKLNDSKIVNSYAEDDYVLDYDEKGNVVNIEILHFNLEDIKEL